MSPSTVPATGGRIGVLLVNLGTPDATGYWPMRRYLKEFLSDRRVIEENRIKWWFVLNFIILTVRPGRKGRDYDKIWNKERNESPLKTITRSQSDKLDEIFDKIGEMARSGLTTMLVEQNAARALEISNRAYVLELGRNRFEGTGRDLLANPEVRRMYLGG